MIVKLCKQKIYLSNCAFHECHDIGSEKSVMLINFKNVSISDGKISSLHLLNFKSSLLTLIDFERTEFAMLQKHIIFQVGIITSSLFT